MNKKWWIVTTVVVLIGVLVVASCQGRNQDAEAQATEETAIVRRGVLRVTADATGSLSPHSEVALAFSSSGRVDEVLVVEGQQVEAGQALAQLDTDDLALQVAQAEAALAATEAQLAQLLAPPQPEQVAAQEANLRAMEAQVSAAAANRDQLTAGADEGQIAAAEATWASATAQQKSAFDGHERTMTCRTFTLPDGSEKTVCPALGAPEEQARYGLETADASLSAAQAQLDELQAGADADQVRAAHANVATAAAQRDAAQAQLDLLLVGATEAQIETTQAKVDEARVGLEQAQLRLEKGTLTASIAGTVTFLGVEPGQIVNANQPVVVLNDLAIMEVDVYLDETDVARVAVGQEAQVSLDAFPGVEMIGEVAYIAPVAQTQSGVVLYPITICLALSDPSTGSGQGLPARAGMTADVEIVTVSQEDVLIVPLRAVHTEGERSYVNRVAGDQIEQVTVELDLMTDTEIEITNGLSEGDMVVVE